jgi:hypothetical protein
MSESDSRNRRRSQRVALQVSVLLRAALIDGKSVQLQAFTSAVNAHGGLLETPVRLAADQRILLINPYTRNDIGCRVVRVDGPSQDLYEVAFEFDRPNPQFWPIAFPPEDWAVTETPESNNT